jgi:hypothetical protein
MRIKSYLEILKSKSEELNVPLLDAFKWKDISNSTYYRTINGATELSYDTAYKVNLSLHELHSLRKHREELKAKSEKLND